MSVIGRNIVWLLISQVATWTATLVTLIVVPDRLGSADFGAYGYAVGYVLFFTLIAGLGTSMFLSRAVARDRSLVGPYVWNGVMMKLILVAVLSAMAYGFAYAIGNRGATLTMIAIGCVGMLTQALAEVFAGALSGLQRMAPFALWTMVQVYFQTILGIIVVLAGWGVVAYAAVMTAGSTIPAIAMGIVVWPMVRGHRVFDLAIWRLLVTGGAPLLALTFFGLIYGTVNVPILHAVSGSEAVGWFVLSMRWVGIPVFITTAVSAAYFPAFSQEGNPMTARFAPLVNESIHLVLLVALPAGIGIGLVADEFIPFFYPGGDYGPSIVLIQISAALTPITALDTMLGTALVAADRLNRYLYVSAAAAVLNPIACVVLIHWSMNRWDNGAIGAAVTMVATEVFVMFGALRLRSPGVLDRHAVLRLVRVVAAVAVMSIVVVGTAGLPFLLQIGSGIVSYAVAALLFGAISVAELRRVVDQLKPSSRRRQTTDGRTDQVSGENDTDVGSEDATRVRGDLHPGP